MWRKGKRDGNEKEIFDTARKLGWQVYPLTNQALDAIVYHRIFGTGLLEVKNKKTTFLRNQLELISEWNGVVFIAKSEEDIINFANNPFSYLISKKQKQKIQSFLVRNPTKKTFTNKQIEELLNDNTSKQ